MDSLTPELYMAGPDKSDEAKKTKKKSASELFAEDILRGAIERSKRKLEKVLQPTIGDSIFQILEKEQLGKKELEKRVKDMTTNGYNTLLFKATLEGYLKRGYIKRDESGKYSLNYDHELFRHLR